MRTNRRSGTTLIEVLVVIVIFLVGILAVVQVFPPGLNVLRTTSRNSIATQLGESEITRILSQQGSIAEMIVPVNYQWTASGPRVVIDTNRHTNDLMAPKDPGNLPGRINAAGQVKVGGNLVGAWGKVSGSNLFNRVIGESRPVPGPAPLTGGAAGSLVSIFNLTFGPAYYFPVSAGGIGEDGVIQVYGNDMARRFGNRDFNIPNPFGRFREGEFFYVAAEDTDDTNFQGEDQVWVAKSSLRKYRVAFSFAYDNQGVADQFDVIVQANLDPANPPTYAKVVGNYWVISLPQIISLPDIYGNPSQFSQANYKFAEGSSVRMERLFQEIRGVDSFDPNDPYQYKVYGASAYNPSNPSFSTGTLLFNPVGFNFKVTSTNGANDILQARVDYTVYDWRLIRDEFRVPVLGAASNSSSAAQVKLKLSSIKANGTDAPDGLPISHKFGNGLELDTPTLDGQSGQWDDVVVQDLDTGAIILGNKANDPNSPGYPQHPNSAWSVDKVSGQMTFFDTDQSSGNGLTVQACLPDLVNGGFQVPRPIRLDDHNIRVLYMSKGEWSVQPFKAARTYRISNFIGANGLGPGACFIGGTLDNLGVPVGRSYRIYFAPYELGQKVIAGEMWTNVGTGPTALYDQEIQISGLESVNGVELAYADIHDKTPGTANFDWSQGYAVRRVRGASLKVRTMWNPTRFKLEADEVKNYSELEVWMRSWRRSENESMQIGGRN